MATNDALTSSQDRSFLVHPSKNAALEAGYDGPPPVGPLKPELRRCNPPVDACKTVDTNVVHGELLTFHKRDLVQLEFLLRSHLIVLLPDGISGGCQWSNGRLARKLSPVVPETILFNPAGEYLSIRTRLSQNDCRVLSLLIGPEITERFRHESTDLTSLEFRQEIGLEDQGVRQVLLAIQQEIETPGLNSRFYINTLLTVLFTRLIRCASNLAPPRPPTYTKGGLPNWRLRRAIELLEGDPSKTPSLVELAQPLRLHPTSFCRAFKQSTGMSPHRYLLVHRVNRAKKMMKDQKLTLTQIALECGFGGSSQFSVVFKRIAGVSPSEYRRAL
jgi:AraC-like DNA-binding protein